MCFGVKVTVNPKHQNIPILDVQRRHAFDEFNLFHNFLSG
jgi:hypothetical protein